MKLLQQIGLAPYGAVGVIAYNCRVVDMVVIGAAIRDARVARSWGQEQLSNATKESHQARRAISVQAISEIETGTTVDPRLGTIARLCKALSLTVEIEANGSARVRETPERLSSVGASLSSLITPEIAAAVVTLAFAALDAVGHPVAHQQAASDSNQKTLGGEDDSRMGRSDSENL